MPFGFAVEELIGNELTKRAETLSGQDMWDYVAALQYYDDLRDLKYSTHDVLVVFRSRKEEMERQRAERAEQARQIREREEFYQRHPHISQIRECFSKWFGSH